MFEKMERKLVNVLLFFDLFKMEDEDSEGFYGSDADPRTDGCAGWRGRPIRFHFIKNVLTGQG